MTMKELVLKNRSYRRFHQNQSVSIETLKELVDLARLSATGGNMQPLKFMVSCDDSRNALIFPQLGCAAYLKDWAGPADGERPSAYIIILGDKRVKVPRSRAAGHLALKPNDTSKQKGLILTSSGCPFHPSSRAAGYFRTLL